jgi:lysine-N-methylase
MQNVRRVRQPKCFERFRCIGADCEDTCCVGWGILVDRETYEKYQNLSGQLIGGKALSSLVEINIAASSSKDYAKFRLNEAGCPALNQRWCSIQQTLGETYIPDLCSTYPRVLTGIGGTLERSLHLSCPEAARLVLNDPDAMFFHDDVEHGGVDEAPTHRTGSVTRVDGGAEDCRHGVQALIIEAIRERSLPLWQRIVSLGFAVDRLAGLDMMNATAVLKDHLERLRRGAFDDTLATLKADSAFQLETVLELIVTRIGSDYTSPRFLECYRDFMHGLAWTAESTMEELADRHSRACRNYFLPFCESHEHLLENYLINYIFRTVFPYRTKLPGQKFAIDSSGVSMRNSFALLSVHYAIVRTVLVGMAALYKDNLTADHAVKLVQSYSKAFLHSTSFDTTALEYLEKNAGDHKVAELVMD